MTVTNPPDIAATDTWVMRELSARWEHDQSPICPCGDPILPGGKFRLRVLGAGVQRWHVACAKAEGAPPA